MALNKRLIEILVCPICKGSLDYSPLDEELICSRDHLAYPVRDDIPVMLPSEARSTLDNVTVEDQTDSST